MRAILYRSFILLAITFGPNSGLCASFCTDGTSIFTPAVEFKKGSKRVLFLGTIHGAPQGYYPRLSRKIASWSGSASTKILTEFYTCNTTTLNLRPGVLLSNQQLQEFSVQASRSTLRALTQPEPCILDQDHKTKRPVYLADRNRTECASRHAEGFDCQWGDFLIPENRNIAVEPGDFVVDSLPPGGQALASIGYRPAADFENQSFVSLFKKVMVDDRNAHLASQVTKTLKTADQVILPWGAGHLEDVQKFLESEGFKQASFSGVLFGGPNNLGSWNWYDENFQKERSKATRCPEIYNPQVTEGDKASTTGRYGARQTDAIK